MQAYLDFPYGWIPGQAVQPVWQPVVHWMQSQLWIADSMPAFACLVGLDKLLGLQAFNRN